MDLRKLEHAVSHYLPEILGYGFWWAWLLVALNTPLLYDGGTARSLPSLLNWASVASGAVLSFALAFFLKKNPSSRAQTSCVVVSSVLLCICTVGVYAFVSMGNPGGNVFLFMAGLSVGLALSVLQIFWGVVFFGRRYTSETSTVTVLSFAFALVVAALSLGKGLLSIALAAAFPLASGALLIGSARRKTADKEAEGDVRNEDPSLACKEPLLPIGLSLLLFFFALSFGVFRSLLPSSFEIGYDSFYVMATVCIPPLVIILFVGFLRERNLNFAFTVALPLITLGIFFLSLLESDNYAVEAACMNSGIRCVDLVTWIMVSSVARESPAAAVRVYSIGRGLGCLGALTGFVVGAPLSAEYGLALSASLLMLLVLLAVSTFHIVKTDSRLGHRSQAKKSIEPEAASGETPDAAIADVLDARPLNTSQAVGLLSKRYYLSAREQEVLELLATGRSVNYIAEKLVIARSTVSTHVHNIYRKLEVHNRQELLNMVEDCMRA